MYLAGKTPPSGPTTTATEKPTLSSTDSTLYGSEASSKPLLFSQLGVSKAATLDYEQRKHARHCLAQCLQEINFLTYAKTLHPAPERAQESVGAESGEAVPFSLTRSVQSLATSPSISHPLYEDPAPRPKPSEHNGYRPSPLGPSGARHLASSSRYDEEDNQSSRSCGSSSRSELYSTSSAASDVAPVESDTSAE